MRGVLLAGFLCLAVGKRHVNAQAEGPPPAVAPVSSAELAEAVRLSSDYLRRHCDSAGRFVYRRHRDRQPVYDAKTYNLLRHAGAMYALSMDYDRTREPGTRETLGRAAGYLRSFVAPVPNTFGALAVWTDPGKLGKKNPDQPLYAKLGGTGLGLVALVGVERIQAETIPVSEARALGRFLLFMQTPEGRFFSKYAKGTGVDREWVSLYYPGEAVLGLLMLHDLDPDPAWLDAAARGMACLARERRNGRHVPADHWALIATAKLIRKYDQVVSPPCTRDALVQHAVQLVNVILAEQKTGAVDDAVRGSFLDDARTTPTAIRLEGLLAALTFIPSEMADLRSRTRSACHSGMQFLLRTRIRAGDLRGGVPRAARPLPSSEAAAEFNRRVGEVRIDYVQHALSAMILYRELMASTAGNR